MGGDSFVYCPVLYIEDWWNEQAAENYESDDDDKVGPRGIKVKITIPSQGVSLCLPRYSIQQLATMARGQP